MKAREYQRITIPPLPGPDTVKVDANGKIDIVTVREMTRKYNEVILNLLKRDEDKEKRLQRIEERMIKISGKRAEIKYFGERYRIVVEDGLPPVLNAERSDDGWQTVAQITQLAP